MVYCRGFGVAQPPGPTAVGVLPTSWTNGWEREHRQFRLRLTRRQYQRIEDILRVRGLDSVREFLDAMIDLCHSERLPESQGDVKRVIPSEVATLAAEALAEKGQFLIERAARAKDMQHRAELRAEAKPLLDAASWFDVVEDDRHFREHILNSGQRTARHRLKPPDNPEIAMSSATREAPMG